MCKVLEIRLLGAFELKENGEKIEISSRPARILLAYLLLHRGTEHPREKLAGLLWPDSSEDNARKNLRQALWRLRNSIGDPYLLVDTHSIAFNDAVEMWLDIEVLEGVKGQDLEQAVSIYKGELLPGFYEEWILRERDRLEAAYEGLMQHHLSVVLKEQRWMEAIHWAERWIAQGHFPEAAYRALMVAHASTGDIPKVEAAYQRCLQALQQEIGVEPSEETELLYQRLLAGEKVAPPPPLEEREQRPRLDVKQIHLPAQPTPFIGRKQELTDVNRLFSEARLLSLIGPGGIGKTRLAIKAAEEVAAEFRQGCYFVALAPIQAAEHLVQTIAEAVRFPVATHEDPKLQLLRYLQERELLLVMDNFEHLLDGVVLVNEILDTAPDVKILITSRERLNLQGETCFVLRGMGFPEGVGGKDTGKHDAISLFIQTAGRVRTDFDPSVDEVGQIAKICEIVEGIPLAIELAAAWLHILNVDEIAAEIEKGLDILATEMRDTPERHRSMRAVFDHSYSRLKPKEREIFSGLSVFRGGFTREAAQRVTGASLQQLASLINKSLLNHDPDSGRIDMHELLRQYAEEKLEQRASASDPARESHAAYYADLMQAATKDLRGSRQMQVLAEIEADIENIRRGWRYYLAKQDAPQLWKFIYGLWQVYWIRWWNHAGMELFAEAARALDGDLGEELQSLRALAMVYQSYFMGWLGLPQEGYEIAAQCIQILKGVDLPEALVFAYDSLAVNSYFLQWYEGEIKAIEEMVRIARESSDRWLLALVLFAPGMAALMKGDYVEARILAKESLSIYDKMGDRIGSTMPMIVMGHAALLEGQLEEASDWYLRCLRLSEEVGFHYSMQTSSKYLGKVFVSRGRLEEAEEYLHLSLKITREIGFIRDTVKLLFEYARLRAAQGLFEQAVELLGLVLQHPASHQSSWFEERIIDGARDLMTTLEDQLDPDATSQALERGQATTLESFVAQLLSTSED
jgi:predicted ATPase/DNA-binding SARP family transcriptional activator